MNITPRVGMATPLIVAIILIGAALAGAALYQMQDSVETTQTPSDVMMDDERDEMMEKDDGMMMEKDDDAMMDDKDTMMESGAFEASGTVLAGTTTPFIDFNRADFDKAVSEGKVILLYFYANWCPICRVEVQDTESAFRELSEPNVVGFRVSYNDNETDDDEESLARQHGIAYQHTKVILVDGTRVLKDGSTWDRDRYIAELTERAN